MELDLESLLVVVLVLLILPQTHEQLVVRHVLLGRRERVVLQRLHLRSLRVDDALLPVVVGHRLARFRFRLRDGLQTGDVLEAVGRDDNGSVFSHLHGALADAVEQRRHLGRVGVEVGKDDLALSHAGVVFVLEHDLQLALVLLLLRLLNLLEWLRFAELKSFLRFCD